MSSSSTEIVQYFVLSDDVIFQNFDEKALLVDLDSEKVYQLNRTGAQVIQLLNEGHSLQEVYTILSGEYHVSQAVLSQEIEVLLANLMDHRLIHKSIF